MKHFLLLAFCICAVSLIAQSPIPFDSIKKIMSDQSTPFIDRYHKTADIGYLSREEQIEICNMLLPEAKSQEDKAPLMKLYSLIAIFYQLMAQFDFAEIYLDSAFMYEAEVENKVILGVTHYSAGEYYSQLVQPEKAHQHYYKAIGFFEENGTKSPIMIEIYYNLSIYYIHQRDEANLKNLINKMHELNDEMGDKYSSMLTYSVLSQYHEILYEKDSTRYNLLDSMYFYNAKSINIFHSIDNYPTGYDWQVAYNYLDQAKYFLYSPTNESLDSVLYYVKTAQQYANPYDSIINMRTHNILGYYYFQKGEMSKAEYEFNSQLELLTNKMKQLDYYYEYTHLYEMLSKISEAQGKYVLALKYERLKADYENKLVNTEKYKSLHELQTKYEVDKKEQEIFQLTEINQYQKRIQHLYIGILILIFISLVFLARWVRIKQKANADRLQIAKMKQEEGELQYQLKEEQATRAETEKYEALSELRLKELELEGKDEKLLKLMQEKETLDKQFNIYLENLKKYEEFKLNTELAQKTIFNELQSQITKRNEKQVSQELVDKMKELDTSIVARLNNHSKEPLSITNIKYCICFAIGMDVKQVATAFSLEPSSIHMTRYRLKQRFNLSKDDDLDLFLKALV